MVQLAQVKNPGYKAMADVGNAWLPQVQDPKELSFSGVMDILFAKQQTMAAAEGCCG